MTNFKAHKVSQNGYALLTTSLVLLLAISITSFYTLRSMRLGQIEENNIANSRLAFQAAEAGLEFGIGFLNTNKSQIIVDSDNDGSIDSYNASELNNMAFVNGTTYTITYRNPNISDFSIIEVRSIGTASGGTFAHTITQLVKVFPLVPSPPGAGLTALSSVALSGNAEVTNTSGSTIRTGSTATLSGSASTEGPGGVSSSSGNINSDVIQNDTNISSLSGDQFFQAFFGESKTQIQNNADLVYNFTGDSNISSTIDGVEGKSIWINNTNGTTSLNSNIEIGSPTKPVVLVINGPFSINGNVTIHGMVYIIGNWNNNGGGNASIEGALVVEGTAQSTGTPDLTYSPSIMANLSSIGLFTKVPGSWKDF